MSANNENQLKHHIEEVAKLFEMMHFNPMQGRILAYLSAGGETEKTFDEIVSFFGTSKSTVSNSLNYLISQKLVDYKTVSGKRKRFFFLTENLPVVYSRQQLEVVRLLKELSYKTITLQSSRQKELNRIMHGWIGFANRFEKMLEDLLREQEEGNIQTNL